MSLRVKYDFINNSTIHNLILAKNPGLVQKCNNLLRNLLHVSICSRRYLGLSLRIGGANTHPLETTKGRRRRFQFYFTNVVTGRLSLSLLTGESLMEQKRLH